MEQEPQYQPISPGLLFPSTSRDFSLFTKRGNQFKVYCYKDDPFTQEHKDILAENGLGQVYVQAPDKGWFKSYAQNQLGSVLQNHDIPLAERSRAFYDASLGVVKDAIASKLPGGIDPAMADKIRLLVEESLVFLSREETLRSLGALMAHDFETYSHSVNVFVLSSALLQAYNRYNHDDLVQVGVGAMLHDIGKTELDAEIINQPGGLSSEQMEQVRCHPLAGCQLCAGAELGQACNDVILYHHEKLDGTGYPCGLVHSQIPLYVRAVTIVDIYDALTSRRPYAPPLAPFDALNLMRREFEGKIDPVLYERFVKLLSCTL